MLRSLLAGRDGPNQRALPAGEFLHPLPLAALVLLVVNDWWLKPGTWVPGALTGKLSDVAGLLFFPLLVTALADCVGLGLHRIGFRVDFTLRHWKIRAALVLTAVGFAAVKLSPTCNLAAVHIMGSLGLPARIVLDPGDLVALPMLWVAWRVARAEIARVPLGRIELIEARHRRSGVGVGTLLDDTLAAGASPVRIVELTEAFDEYLKTGSEEAASRVRSSLAELRDLSLPGR